MIDLAVLEQYFPEPNKPIKDGPYTFTIYKGFRAIIPSIA